MSKKAETKNAVILARAETARMEHLIEGHWRPEVERLRDEVERLTQRRVETAEELDALPTGAVVRASDGTIYERGGIGAYERHWFYVGDSDPQARLASGDFPAIVLWLPEVSS